MNIHISEDVVKNLAILFLYLIDNMLNPRYDSIVEQVFQKIDYMIHQRDNISDYLVNNNISEDVTRILWFSLSLIDNTLNTRYNSIVEQVFQYIDYMIAY